MSRIQLDATALRDLKNNALAQLESLSLKHKLVALIAFLALAPVLGAILSYQSLKSLDSAQELALRTKAGQTYIERANGLLYAVGMDSRGVYMSADWQSAKPYAEGILRHLGELEKTVDSWAETVADEQRQDLAAAKTSIGEFIGFRRELVRLAREASVTAARQFGDNPANRANRRAVNQQLREASSHYDTYVANTEAIYGQARDSAVWTTVITGLISLIALAGGIWLVIQNLARPIERMTHSIREIAAGRTEVEVYGVGRGDEIGQIADAVNVFKQNMLETERMRTEQAERDKRAAAERKAEMKRIADEFQKTVGRIVDTVSNASAQLETAAGQLTTNASSTQELSSTVASASEQTSVNVQGVATASEELSSTVQEISRQVHESSVIADEAVRQASDTNANVSELAESAERIGAVVELINQIAGQTNLLALNATIEAARAGDAGKGFAVVAQEVKALAAQTAKATSDIANQIQNMQNSTRNTVDAINQIASTINRISSVSGAIAAAVEQQGATTQEISRNVMEAAKGTSEVASSITAVSEGASNTGTASSQVLASARSLSSDSRSLKAEVERFLETVRAA